MCSNVFVYGEDNIRVKDKQLVKVLLAAAKKAFTTKWEWEDIPTQDQWTHLIGNLHNGNDNALPETAGSADGQEMDNTCD